MAFYDIQGNEVLGDSFDTAVTPVSLSTVNAMLKCAYTYIDACRAGDLVYGNGTGVNQREGTICCVTFCRQLMQGIPYNDYLPANASTTTASGNRWQYGYRMLGEDYYAESARATADVVYHQFEEVGRAIPTDYKLEKALPGDMIIFGSSLEDIRHIGMFVYKDAQGVNYIMDSNITSRNGNLGIRIHKAYDHTAEPSNNPVGLVRPNLSDTIVPTDEIEVTANNGVITGEVLNGYGQFLKITAEVTAGTPVTFGDFTYTPRYSGKTYYTIPVLSTTSDTNTVMNYSGATIIDCKMSHYL